MPTSKELEEKFWKALKSDMTMMVGLDGEPGEHPRPMTAQLDGDRGPIWFFTSKDTELFQSVGEGRGAISTFVDKGHELFATVHGKLNVDNDRAVIDRLWNPFVAAWYEGAGAPPPAHPASRSTDARSAPQASVRMSLSSGQWAK